MTLEEWVEGKHRRALLRARLQAGGLALALLAALAWLGWREAGMPARLLADTVRQQEIRTTDISLKRLGLAAYLAKVRRNCLLKDITGSGNSEDACVGRAGLGALPESDPCVIANRKALEALWLAAFDGQAPPLGQGDMRDAWGAPLLVNEAEYVCARGDGWCPPDTVRSVGPDGAFGTSDDRIGRAEPFVYRKR